MTTTDAGMAVPDWPSTYGYNLFLYPWQSWIGGPWDLFVEHGHRLLGALAGILTIALVTVVWVSDRRKWLRGLSLAALGLIVFQGVLGGLRVLFDARQLALIHGCVGPAFFALCVSLAVFTSQRWKQPEIRKHADAGKLHRFACLTVLLLYVQLIVGANVRHVPVDATPGSFRAMVYFHLVMALIVTAHVLFLALLVVLIGMGMPALLRPGLLLGLLILLQLTLGVATWVVKYGWPAELTQFSFASGYTIRADSFWSTNIVTAHVATGSLLLGVASQLALRSLRLLRVAPPEEPMMKGAVA